MCGGSALAVTEEQRRRRWQKVPDLIALVCAYSHLAQQAPRGRVTSAELSMLAVLMRTKPRSAALSMQRCAAARGLKGLPGRRRPLNLDTGAHWGEKPLADHSGWYHTSWISEAMKMQQAFHCDAGVFRHAAVVHSLSNTRDANVDPVKA